MESVWQAYGFDTDARRVGQSLTLGGNSSMHVVLSSWAGQSDEGTKCREERCQRGRSLPS
jgi:hypothetical protein